MTWQTHKPDGPAGLLLRRGAAAPAPGDQPIFFFDGDFRTWAQVERRARLNRAIADHVANHRSR